MPAETTQSNWNWLCTGREIFPAMLAAIADAQTSVCLETYIYSAGPLGQKFRDALVAASRRGVRVRVLVDGLGSYGLHSAFWDPLKAAGGEARTFNPLALDRLGIRNHRKLLVCDGSLAFVGGFNISDEYEGDGVTCGWCDVGLELRGALAAELVVAFDEMFSRADFRHKRFVRFRKAESQRAFAAPCEQLLLSGPGRGRNPIKRALRKDLASPRSVRIIAAYFLPTWRIRRQLCRLASRGTRVQLVLAGKSDVRLSQLAGRSLYRRFLKAGVEIYEYQPQILHAKMLLIDEVTYVGSANLDQRSLNINYELMVRLEGAAMAASAREVYERTLTHSQKINLEQWSQSRSLWRRLKERWAYFVLVRIDPYIAKHQWRALPD